ncbi:hypothetical protein MKW94_018827, partial [Papaver nudicaule]|nr:hypothetical protein [Papaver nudicaule]
MEVVEDSLEVIPLMNGSHGTEVECICLDENATEKTKQEVGVDEPVNFSSILLNESIDQVLVEIQQNSQALLQITKAINTKKAGQSQLMLLLDLLSDREKVLREMEHEKRWVDHLDQTMSKLHAKIYERPEKGSGQCSSEEELNNLIRSLHYRMQHGKRTLVEVKQLHKEIKQLEETREKYIGLDLDTIRKKRHLLSRRIEYAKKLERSILDEASPLYAQQTSIEQRNIVAHERFHMLRRLRDKGNVNCYEINTLLNNARALATTNSVADLEKLSSSQVEKFMSLWNSSEDCRDDCVQRILPSHDWPLDRDAPMTILEGKNQESETDWGKFMEVIRREDEVFQAKLDLQMKKQVLDKSARKKFSWHQNVAEEKLR